MGPFRKHRAHGPVLSIEEQPEFEGRRVPLYNTCLAAMEAAFEKLLADPAYQALVLKGAHVLRDVRMELYQPLP